MAETEATATQAKSTTQKKRSGKRTALACSECRLRKAKCDGLQPCEACRTSDRYCTYNLSAGQSTGSGTRIRILEDRLRRARAYLSEAQRRDPSLARIDFDALLGSTEGLAPLEKKRSPSSDDGDKDQERLNSMMDSYGQMTIDRNGSMERDFYGAASGLAWIRKTRDYLDDSGSAGSSSSDDTEDQDSPAVQLFDAPLPRKQAFQNDLPINQLLPPRETATKLLRTVFGQAYPLFAFLDEENFHASMDRIYQLEASRYSEQDQMFLPLFSLVMGLGYLFSKEEHDGLGCRTAVAQGMRHFVAARSMLDLAHLRTTVSLQTMICLILFLVSTARMGSAHAFLGTACAAAMRQGLHFRSNHELSVPDKEKRVRRRVFWAVINLDMYVSGVLGLPPFMDISAVDPAIDLTIDIALKEVRTGSGLSLDEGLGLAASAKHIELMRVVFKAQRTLYPKPTDPPGSKEHNGTISVSVRKLQGVEDQYRDWALSLKDILTYNDESTETQSIKYEIQICYYFAQIILYRPFLHYLAKQHDGDDIGQRQLSYAKTCVKMATKAIEVSIDHQRKGLLCPASWPSVYTVFISIVCLVFSYATTTDNAPLTGVKEDIENGIRLLASTACTTDTGSVRCLEILRRLIERVSYAVDINLDEVCAHTKPCCTTEFVPRPGTPQDSVIDELHLPPMDAHRPTTAVATTSQDSSNIGFASDGHQWSFTPVLTMTRPSFMDIDYSIQGQNQNVQSYFPADEELLQIPYTGDFHWAQNQMPASAGDYGHSGGSTSHPDTGLASFGPATSNTQRRLTAEDIAAFMQNSGADEPFARPSDYRE